MDVNNTSLRSNNQETEENQGNLIETLLRDYIPYWPVIVLALVLGLVAAKIYLRYETNYYQVGTSILLKDESQSADNLLKQVAFNKNATFIDDEMELIQGMGVMRGATKRLNAQVQIFTTGRIREEFKPIAVAPFDIILLRPDSMKVGKVAFDYSKDGALKIEGKTIPLNRTVNILGNYVIFKKKDDHAVLIFDTTNLQEEVDTSSMIASQYLAFRSLDDAVRDVAGSVTLTKDKKTSVIKVNTAVTNIEYGKLLLNAIVDSYQQETQDEKRKKARYTVDFIDSRLMYVGNDLDSVESKLENYKKQNDIQRLSKEAELFLEKVKDGDKMHAEIEVQLLVLDELENYVKGKIKKGGMAPSLIGLEDAHINEYFTQLNAAENKYAALREQNGPENDQVKVMAGEIVLLKATLQESIRSARVNLNLLQRKAESNYQRYEGEYDLLMRSIPSKERALFAITRQQDLKNALYIYLLQKREESAIQMAGTLSDIRVIESTKAGALVSPKRQIIYLGFGMGFALAVIGILFLKSSMNDKVMSKSEIERRTAIPVIGELDFIETDSPLILKDGNRSLIAEQMRSLRTNLGFLNMGGRSKLLVSSSFPGEGKSFLATNIAIGYSLAGKKVLLIESDMRKPNISKHFNLK